MKASAKQRALPENQLIRYLQEDYEKILAEDINNIPNLLSLIDKL